MMIYDSQHQLMHSNHDRFDQDFGHTHHTMPAAHSDSGLAKLDHHWFTHDHTNEWFQQDDPLKYSHHIQFKPLVMDLGDQHFVHPHAVAGYVRKDGVHANGYYRDGDGDTSMNRTTEQGGGYFQANPTR